MNNHSSKPIIPNTLLKFVVLFSVFLSSFVSADNAYTAIKTELTLDGAKFIAAAAAEKAKEEQWQVVIVVTDAGGKIKYVERMDNAQLASIDVAIEKATTAALYRRSTKVFHERVKAGDIPITTLPHMLAFDGALPIKVAGEVVGAIGVSGVKGFQDAEISQAGVDAFEKMLSKNGK